MRSIITGGAGFIGSNLVNTLSKTDKVIVLDNFSTGDLRFLDGLSQKIELIDIDIAKTTITNLQNIFEDADRIFHLAANADVRGGWENYRIDIDQNLIATSNVAEGARRAGIPEIIFTSTGCVYGDSKVIPTLETEQFPIQTSLYGTSKVAAEGILSSYSAQGVFKVTIFRFVSVLGKNYHHGHVIDFVNKLINNSDELEVLGNGNQKKSYVHVEDCILALEKLRNPESNFEVFNIGHDTYKTVKESAELIANIMKCNPKFKFGKEDRGWVGDNPFTYLDISKAQKFGWNPKISIEDSIIQTVEHLLNNSWILGKGSARNS